MNIQSNQEFKKLFQSIKQRFSEKGVEDESLYPDMIEAINNMITAIELGKGDEAFTGLFLYRLNRIFDERLPAAAAISCKDNTPTLFFNPQLLFMMCNDYEDFLVIVTHEVYHLVFKHLIPSRNYPNHDRTNIAMDTSVNQYINNISSNLAKQIYTLENFNKEFNCKAQPKREFEYYYDLIPKDFGNNVDPTLQKLLNDLANAKDELNKALNGDGNGNNNEGNGSNKESVNNEKSKEDDIKEKQDKVNKLKKEILDYIKENYVLGDITSSNSSKKGNGLSMSEQLILDNLVESAIEEGKQKGKIPGSMTETINNLYFKNPIISWKKELRNMIGSVPCPYRKTMRVKNRRMPARSDLLGRVNDHKLNITIAIDTSGSVSDEELKYFFNEIFNIIKDCNTEITLIQCDAAINRVDKIKKKEDVKKVKVSGRGGTSFSPVFEYIKNNMKSFDYPDIIIYCTDGYGEKHIERTLKPKSEILWVLTGYDDNLSVMDKEFRKKIRLLNIEGKKYI